MANGWVHSTLTLVAFGRPYSDLHRTKDAPCRILGSKHRLVSHDWYWRCGSVWTLENPYPVSIETEVEELGITRGPDFAELRQVSVAHDYLDRLWDGMDQFQRKYFEACMLWLLLNRDFLMKCAGLDLIEGGIQRVVDGREIWEPCPELQGEYLRLRNYADYVRRKDPLLRDFLARYG